MDLDVFLQTSQALIEERLHVLVPPPSKVLYSALFDAARYSLFSGGKRLRPLLALASAHTFGAELEKALDPACALECIHTYSLIHDDLPCMDNDDLRRGKPTLHRVFPEWHALLTGDYLATFAFEILAACTTLTDGEKIELVHILSSRAGARGMIGGQIIDLMSQGHLIDIYRNNLKNQEFDKKASQNPHLESATIVRAQGANKDENFEKKPTPSKIDSSGCFGIYRNNLKNQEFDKEASQNPHLESATIVRAQGANEDENFEKKPTPSKTDSSGCFGITLLQEMHANKTAALISASLEFGAIVARASAQDRLFIKKCGIQIGIAFQIADDILDASPHDGRKKTSDEIEQKVTAVSLLGLEEANRCKDALLTESLSDLCSLSKPAPLLKALFHKLVHRSN
jgi:geranylgeranyl pyrophosphate synthase